MIYSNFAWFHSLLKNQHATNSMPLITRSIPSLSKSEYHNSQIHILMQILSFDFLLYISGALTLSTQANSYVPMLDI